MKKKTKKIRSTKASTKSLAGRKETSKNLITIPSAQSDDQPASRKLLWAVRDELNTKMDGIESRLESKLDYGFQKIDLRFQEVNDRVKEQGAYFGLKIQEMKVLFEEQNSNNRIVLEGIQALWQRQDRIEKEVR